ncbi:MULTISPECIES: hypothetical protein [Pseudomonas syringae group]|nr:hypothetical protein [Pseudomonas syringae group genomosp. 3]
MLLHNDIAVPQSVVKAWGRLQEVSDTKALDELFKFLPAANALDKTALAMMFVKHLEYLQSDTAQVPQELDHLYNALSGISAEEPGKAVQIIQGLFEYGIARLPQEKHTAGLERITTAIQEMAAKRDELSTLQDLSVLSEKLSALSELTSIAITKFQVMPLASDVRERIGMGLLDTISLTQVGRMRHDFALLHHTPDLKLSSAEAESVLDTITSSKNVQAKLDLVSSLVTHFDRLELDDAPKFLAELDTALRPLYHHGVHPDTINQLLERV